MLKWSSARIPSEIKCSICSKVGKARVCRCCGKIFCEECTRQKRPYIPVLPNTPLRERYNPKKTSVNVCDICIHSANILYLEDDFLEGSYELKHIAAWARKAIMLANGYFPVSPSRMYYYQEFDSNLFESKKDKKKHHANAFSILRNPENFDNAINRGGPNRLAYIENTVRTCLKTSIANCSEMASFCYLMFHYAADLGLVKIKDASIVYLPKGDHSFLIVTPISEKEHLPQGSEAIICDPWLKSLVYLKNYRKYFGKNSFKIEGGKGNKINSYSNFKYFIKTGCPEIEHFLKKVTNKKLRILRSSNRRIDDRSFIIENGSLSLTQLAIACKNSMSSFNFALTAKKQKFKRIINALKEYDEIDFIDYSFFLKKIIKTAFIKRNPIGIAKPNSAKKCFKHIRSNAKMQEIIGFSIGVNFDVEPIEYRHLKIYSGMPYHEYL
ncbi:MAG: hypothetical protein GY749_14945 [Desulfobacteraceae bacterium]|nr:hypothetical protein [Desulfobacteraceae bacterium]